MISEVKKTKPYGTIYIVENKINGKKYVGQTIHSFNRRYPGGNIEKYTHNEHLRKSIQKYGIENFKITKDYYIAYSKDELDEKEKQLIAYYDTMNPKLGYNKVDGGGNGVPNEEVRAKLRESKLGDKNGWYGVRGESNPYSKKIYCITNDKIYSSVRECADELNLNISCVSSCCSGERYSTKKYRMIFLEKWETMNEQERLEFINQKRPRSSDFRKKQQIICLDTQEIFDTVSECADKINARVSNLYSCINGNLKTCKGLRFMKLEEWLSLSDHERVKAINSKPKYSKDGYKKIMKKIICLDNKMIFESLLECSKVLNVDRGDLSKACNGKKEHVKGYRFMFYDEYISQNA